MYNLDQVDALRAQMEQEQMPLPERIRQLALACLGWPYVFGAWGEPCTPANRKKRARDAHPTIVSKCQVLSGKKSDCGGCQWYPDDDRVRMYDCRGFTAWLLSQVGQNLAGRQGATSQYKNDANWIRKGPISEMPDCVCCVFKQHGSTMKHTGMHVGGGVIIHCSVNVQTGSVDKSWTHYAIPKVLYSEGEIPMSSVRPTLRKGDRGVYVVEMQEILSMTGYDCGTVDGIFGVKTFNALVLFQTEAKLDPDGVCGPKTWKALDIAEAQAPMAPAEPVLYTVRAEGVTWAQYLKILEICPLAEAEKER